MRCRAVVVVAIILLFSLTGLVTNDAAAAVPGNTYVALLASFKEGDFGTTVTNRLYTLTPEFGYLDGEHELSAAIPLQSMTVSGAGLSSTESGIGDIVFRAGQRLWRDKVAGYSLSGALTLKLATGDENRGLGTGGIDVGISLSGNRDVGAYTFTLLTGYTQTGDSSTVNYDNVFSYGIGINRGFSRSNVFAALQGRTSALPGGTDPLEIDAGVFYLLSLNYVMIVDGFIGLSDGSPDGGIDVGFVRWF